MIVAVAQWPSTAKILPIHWNLTIKILILFLNLHHGSFYPLNRTELKFIPILCIKDYSLSFFFFFLILVKFGLHKCMTFFLSLQSYLLEKY